MPRSIAPSHAYQNMLDKLTDGDNEKRLDTQWLGHVAAWETLDQTRDSDSVSTSIPHPQSDTLGKIISPRAGTVERVARGPKAVSKRLVSKMRCWMSSRRSFRTLEGSESDEPYCYDDVT